MTEDIIDALEVIEAGEILFDDVWGRPQKIKAEWAKKNERFVQTKETRTGSRNPSVPLNNSDNTDSQ